MGSKISALRAEGGRRCRGALQLSGSSWQLAISGAEAQVAARVRTPATQEAPEDARNKIYNVAFGQRTTLNELFALIREEVARHKADAAAEKATYRDFRPGDVRHSLADISKAKNWLGYAPAYDVRQGLRLAGDWYAANL